MSDLLEKHKDSISKDLLLECTTTIIAAYLEQNKIPSNEIATLITDTFKALQGINNEFSENLEEKETEKQKPAISVRKSVQDDYIICLEDGKKLKMLKRYLRTHYNMTPEEYREKWNLPPEYPMVAPNYAAERAAVAKRSGLGLNNSTGKKRGRKPKAAI